MTMTENEREQDTWTAPQVCDETGISYRQLDYWVRTDLITPSIHTGHGSGTRRMFSANDVRLVKFVKNMLDAGIHLQVVRSVVADFVADPPAPGTVVAWSGNYDTRARGGHGVFRNLTVIRNQEDLIAYVREIGMCWVYVV